MDDALFVRGFQCVRDLLGNAMSSQARHLAVDGSKWTPRKADCSCFVRRRGRYGAVESRELDADAVPLTLLHEVLDAQVERVAVHVSDLEALSERAGEEHACEPFKEMN